MFPFDLRSYRLIEYRTLSQLQQQLRNVVVELEAHPETGSPVTEILPRDDAALRAELARERDVSQRLRSEIAAKDAELGVLRSERPPDPAFVSLAEEMRTYLNTLSRELLDKSMQQLVDARSEAERLRVENNLLQEGQVELRRLKQMVLVNPHWKGRDFSTEADLCFVLMPFRESWSDDVWKLVDSIVTRMGFRCRRADQEDGRVIMDDIWENICRARVVIADLTGRNPNVTYEVGLADVLGKNVILLSQTPHDIPFDFLGLRLVTYDNSIAGARRLGEELEHRLAKAKADDSPLQRGARL